MAYFNFKTVLVLLAIAQSGLGLKCYICNSAFEEDCRQSPPPTKYLQECSKENLDNDSPHPVVSPQAPVAPNTPPFVNQTESVPVDAMLVTRQPVNHTVQDVTRTPQRRSVDEKPFVEPLNMTSAATFCRKITYHIPVQNNGNTSRPANTRVVRSCGRIADEWKSKKSNVTCKEIGKEAVKMLQCSCMGNGCNSSSSLGSLTLQTLFLISVMTSGYLYVL